MDGQNAVLVFILEWVWIPIGVAVVWNFLKLHRIDKKMTEKTADNRLTLAVFDERQKTLTGRLEQIDTRNEEQHNRIEVKIDEHHKGVIRRFDNLSTLVKNGNSK